MSDTPTKTHLCTAGRSATEIHYSLLTTAAALIDHAVALRAKVITPARLRTIATFVENCSKNIQWAAEDLDKADE